MGYHLAKQFKNEEIWQTEIHQFNLRRSAPVHHCRSVPGQLPLTTDVSDLSDDAPLATIAHPAELQTAVQRL
jgi:hypothetical protein